MRPGLQAQSKDVEVDVEGLGSDAEDELDDGWTIAGGGATETAPAVGRYRRSSSDDDEDDWSITVPTSSSRWSRPTASPIGIANAGSA